MLKAQIIGWLERLKHVFTLALCVILALFTPEAQRDRVGPAAQGLALSPEAYENWLCGLG